MSASIDSSDHGRRAVQDVNADDLDDLFSDDEASNTGSERSHIDTRSEIKIVSASTSSDEKVQTPSSHPAQKINLSLSNSLNTSYKDMTLSDSSVLKMKTSNVPGPVGLLPILTTAEDLKRLKEDKTARDTLKSDDENFNVKRTKRSSDLFNLNIENYPSYEMALMQLQQLFGREPISIKTATVKARLGIKKRIPLMCAAVTHYDRQENTILLDKTGHIRATFIGDDESFDHYNIRVGHTLVLRNVAVFTATRHRHHYVNIHLQNIIAIQDPLNEMLSLPSIGQELSRGKSILATVEAEILAYADTSRVINETFQIFSQSDLNEEESSASKKNSKSAASSSSNPTFNRIQSAPPPNVAKKFQGTFNGKSSSTHQSAPPLKTTLPTNTTATTSSTIVTSPPSTTEANLLKIVDKPIDANLNSDDFQNAPEFDEEIFGSW